MKNIEEDKNVVKKNRQRGKNKKIGFSQEIITKDVAKKLLSENTVDIKPNSESFINKLNQSVLKKGTKRKKQKDSVEITNTESINITEDLSLKKKQKKSKKKDVSQNVDTDPIIDKVEGKEDETIEPKKTPKRSKKKNATQNVETTPILEKTEENEDDNNEESKSATLNDNSTLSNRAVKKMKYEQLLAKKKLESDILSQQRAQTYLSKYKYDKTNWKFEKKRQAWLLQNLYDHNKLDDKVWQTTVEYFSNSKGKVHKDLLDAAIKIVENEENLNNDENKIKLQRARDIIQNLQE